jgi:hypothetical protein
VRASTASPVSSISSARFRPIARLTATIGVLQNHPPRPPGVAKLASSDATARSHVATSWQPAPVATPCTDATTGCGIDCTSVIISAQRAKRSRKPCRSRSTMSP